MTTNKIIAAAREAGDYADIEYQRRWESGEGGAWSQIRDERFYAIAYRAGMEDAALEFDRRAVLPDGSISDGWYEPDEPAQIIRALKEQSNG